MTKSPLSGPAASGDRSVAATTVNGVASTGDRAVIVAPQIFGISYADARDIAIDVFNENIERLTGEALRRAQERAESIVDKFLAKLRETFPETVENFVQPGMQRALFKVQEAAAYSEDREIDNVLVDVLVERAKESSASLKQVILDEAIQTIPKLTVAQINSLSLIFYLRYTRTVAPPYKTAAQDLASQMIQYMDSLFPIAWSEMALQHLAYAGCLSVGLGAPSIGAILGEIYFGVFSRGINPHAVRDEMRAAFRKMPENTALLYSPVTDRDSLEAYLRGLSMADQAESIENLFQASKVAESEVEDMLAEHQPRLRETFSLWDNSSLKSANLTSVGTAIGYANLRLKSDFDASLDIWIPEN